jgi:hypothetical protein
VIALEAARSFIFATIAVVGTQHRASWSARATVPGIYYLALNSQTSMLRLTKEPSIVVKVTARWSSVLRDAWPYVSSFLGSLLTLPGILAYFKDRKTTRPPSPIIIP